MKTLADRVWYAYHCLPRTGRNRTPPSYRSIEKKVGLSNGTISSLTLGHRGKLEPETLVGVAKVLGVTVDWLLTGEGKTPTPTGSVPPRLPYLIEENDGVAPFVDTELRAEAISRANTYVMISAREKQTDDPLEILAHAITVGLRDRR